LGEDQELLEEILYNDDNLTYGSVVTVRTGPDETITALTHGGVQELRDMHRRCRALASGMGELPRKLPMRY